MPWRTRSISTPTRSASLHSSFMKLMRIENDPGPAEYPIVVRLGSPYPPRGAIDAKPA